MIALITCLVFLVASLGANSVYAYSLGNGDALLSALYVCVAIGVEGVKVVAPLRIATYTWTWRLAVGAMWLLCVAISIALGIGFAGLTRGEASRERAQVADDYSIKRTAYDDAKATLAALPKADVSVAQLELQIAEQRRKAGPCTDRGAVDRADCKALAALRLELAKAEAVAAASARVDAARDALAAAPKPRAEDVQASQVGAMLRALGLSVSDRAISAWLSVLLVVAVELASVVSFRLAARPRVPVTTARGAVTTVAPARAQSAAELALRQLAPSSGVAVTDRGISGSQRALARSLSVSIGTLSKWLADLQTSGVAIVTIGPTGTSIEWSNRT